MGCGGIAPRQQFSIDFPSILGRFELRSARISIRRSKHEKAATKAPPAAKAAVPAWVKHGAPSEEVYNSLPRWKKERFQSENEYNQFLRSSTWGGSKKKFTRKRKSTKRKKSTKKKRSKRRKSPSRKRRKGSRKKK